MRRLKDGLAPLVAALLLTSLVLAQAAGRVEPRAGGWKTWVLASGGEFPLPGPPDAAAMQAELAEVRALVALRDAAAQERIRYWDAGSPAYRWTSSWSRRASGPTPPAPRARGPSPS